MRTEIIALHILIAEDSIADVLLVKEALAACGLTAELQLCKDGEAALSALARCDASNLPDLVIVDLNLPRVDGMDVLRYVRGLPIFDKTPVMVFTSSHVPNDRVEAERFGANVYVTKPPTLDEFLSTVGSAIYTLIGPSVPREDDLRGTRHCWPGELCRRLAHRRLRSRPECCSRTRALFSWPRSRLTSRRVGIGIHPCELGAEKENLG
jgi:CheY-like chemotaxis protein